MSKVRRGTTPQTTSPPSSSAAAEAPACGALLGPQLVPSGLVSRLAQEACLPASMPVGLSEQLIRRTLLSVSLTLVEKDRVLSQMPQFSRFQVDELIKVFDDERAAFIPLVSTDWSDVARLQAQALWSLSALAANRVGSSAMLERAWRKRLLRQAAAQGLRHWLNRLPARWWSDHAVARWAYQDLFAAEHPAWQG